MGYAYFLFVLPVLTHSAGFSAISLFGIGCLLANQLNGLIRFIQSLQE